MTEIFTIIIAITVRRRPHRAIVRRRRNIDRRHQHTGVVPSHIMLRSRASTLPRRQKPIGAANTGANHRSMTHRNATHRSAMTPGIPTNTTGTDKK